MFICEAVGSSRLPHPPVPIFRSHRQHNPLQRAPRSILQLLALLRKRDESPLFPTITKRITESGAPTICDWQSSDLP